MAAKLMRAAAFVGAIAAAAPGWAQEQQDQRPIDWCAQPLSPQADPKRPMATQIDPAILWRLRCTIQKLDNGRHEAMDHATQLEVEMALMQEKMSAMQAELDAARKMLSETEAKRKKHK